MVFCFLEHGQSPYDVNKSLSSPQVLLDYFQQSMPLLGRDVSAWM